MKTWNGKIKRNCRRGQHWCNRMRGKLFFVALFAVAGLSGWLLGRDAARAWSHGWIGTSESADAGPRAVLSHRQQDLGKVPAGAPLRATFSIANTGSRRLIISGRAGTCDCLSPGQTDFVVAPGESCEIEVELDSSRLRGPIHEVVYYTSNDPRLPRFALVVTADVSPPPSAVQRRSRTRSGPQLIAGVE